MTDYTDIASVVVAGQNTSVQVSDADREIRDGSVSPIDLLSTLSASLRKPGNLVAAMGDSITRTGADGSLLRAGAVYHAELAWRSMGRIRWGGYYATGGYTIQQIIADHLPQVLALSGKLSACIVFAGTNHMAAGATTQDKADYLFILDRLTAAGILPIPALIPPNNLASTARNIERFNAWVAATAASRGLPVLPAYDALVDVTTGGYVTGLNTDDTHPSKTGHKAIAVRALATKVFDFLTVQPGWRTKTILDSTNLIPSGYGLFAADANADGRADGWSSVATNTTWSLVTPNATDYLAGKWQRCVRAVSGTGTSVLTQAVSSGFTVGDTIEFSGRFRASGMEAAGTSYSITLTFTGASGAHALEPVYVWGTDVDDALFAVQAVIPAGTTALGIAVVSTVPTSGSTTLDIGELAIRNLTALGIA